MNNTIRRFAVIVISCIGYAAGISLFLDPNSLAPGGVTGIAIMTNHLFNLPTGIVILVINIPILITAIFKFGVKLFGSTIFTLVLSSVFIDLLAPYGPVITDPVLASIAGAVLVGVSLGLIFRAGATTGGADILIKLLRLKYRHIKTGVLYLIFDSAVVLISAVVFQNIEIAMYAGITVFVQAMVLDRVLYGTDGARMLYIISDHGEKIASRFMVELDVGVTYLSGTGAYTQKEKRVMLCAMRKQLLPQAREIVRNEDENAFLIVTHASQVFGEGFKRHDVEDL